MDFTTDRTTECGAQIFPGPTQVESNFSILKGGQTAHRSRMLDLSLEGCLHSKQFDALEGLKMDNNAGAQGNRRVLFFSAL